MSLAARHRSHLVILAIIVAFAGLLRFYSLSTLGYWTDEFCTLSAADGYGLQLDKIPTDQITPPTPDCTRLKDAKPFTHIPAAMAIDDAHPPLYSLMLRLWETCLGDSEAAVRSLNVIFSLLAIVLLYFAARDSVGSSTALTACLLMAVATPQIQLAQEARNYMPVLTFSLLAVIAIQRLHRSPSRKWAAILGLSLLAMMLTHYFAAGPAAAIAGYGLFSLRNRARRLLLIAVAVSAIAFALLWGHAILSQRAVFQNGLGWLSDTAPGYVHRRLLDLCRLPVRFFTEITGGKFQITIAIVGLLMLLSLPILFARRRELRLWILWLVTCIALVAFADFARSTTQLNWMRYTFFATPPAYVLLAAAVRRGPLKLLLPAIAVLLALLTLPTAYIPPWKTDFRTRVQIVGHHLTAEDGLIIAGPDPIADGIMFAAFEHYLPNPPAATAVLTTVPNAATRRRLSRCPHVWIIWMWHDRPCNLPGLQIEDQQRDPYFADLVYGRIVFPLNRPG